ncbi:YceI family protein [Mucilaginibacter sp. L3T2-6]|uniref:YceI family protein n=1 Tax=Mucilaginibacter sp. L3T2-6 TaxID=3062491 RepID=UPI0026761EF2|nr:YceI family protein [Mucilaginibacter sp. L3T2-6]MDO3643276.1 YceI family protein [Mucilaginibacter sp. L3T2-6]MDV6215600.1 YceI family protein [Mucilaginibacter sp. L3T2-6]
MKKFLLPIFLIIISSTAFRYLNSTVTRSAITFKTKNLGIGVSGTIGGLQANVHFNPADLATSTIEASVDAATINTDNSSRDEHLHGEDFFDVSHYPKITLKSVSIRRRGGNNYTGQFNLTIKNRTRLVEIPFTASQAGTTTTFKGSFKLNRLDYGVGSSSLVLSDEVTVNIDAEVKD